MSRIALSVGVAIALLTAVPAHAQREASPPVEFGADAAVTVLFDPTVVVLTLPVSEIRVGVFATPRIEIEPRLGLVAASGSGASYSDISLSLGVLFHRTAARTAPQTYVRPFAAIASERYSGSDSFTTVALGLGVGVKRPIGTRFAFRPELNFSHTFDGDLSEPRNQLQLLLGFSLYSR